jgi:hypothetical protein
MVVLPTPEYACKVEFLQHIEYLPNVGWMTENCQSETVPANQEPAELKVWYLWASSSSFAKRKVST